MQLFGFAGPWSQADDFQAARARVHALGATPRHTAHAGTLPTDPWCAAPSVAVLGDDLVVALKGSPLWLTDHAGATAAATPAAAVAAAYRDVGPRFLEWLHGPFALALFERRNGTVLLAIDRMGIEALAWVATPDGIAFATRCGELARLPRVGSRLRNQALLDYFMMHMIASPNTVYEGVRKLEPGTCLEFARGRATVRRYWNPAFNEDPPADATALEAELHSSLRTAVTACRPDATTGAFLSGGLDSSTVAGVLAQVADGPARTFSIGFGVEAYNELEFARIAATHFKLNAVEYHVTSDDIVESFASIAGAYDEPFGNSSAVPTYFCARIAARHGITHLLAGDGGDELFGGNDRYGRQQVFEHYQRIPQALRAGVIQPLVGLIHPENRVTPLRKLRSYVDQARITLPERFEYWNLMYRSDIGVMLDPEFLASVDPRASLALMTEVWNTPERASLLNRMLFYDWHFTLADNDLRKVGTMCELAGVQVSYPMLDPRVLDMSLRVPSALKMAGTELRTFYKRAMRDFLPRAILDKTKHGFGLPFGVWLKTDARLADMIFALLGDLKARRVVRAEFLDQLIREQRAGDASYFGYAIWDLAMLEAWFKSHPG